MYGRFRPDEGAAAGYGNRIRVKSPAKWGVQIAGMIFQTRSNFLINTARFRKVPEIGFLITQKGAAISRQSSSVYFCLYLFILQFLPALLPQPYPDHPEADSCRKCQR
ncbi:MAG: DUF6783 domain-containing protein [Blautia sp.]